MQNDICVILVIMNSNNDTKGRIYMNCTCTYKKMDFFIKRVSHTKNPDPTTGVIDFGDSNITIMVRAWSNIITSLHKDDYFKMKA